MSQDKLKEIQIIERVINPALLRHAMTAYLNVWSMTCPHCATWLHNGLLQLNGVLIADAFWVQGVVIVTYNPERMTVDDLLKAVRRIGKETCRLYGAELIGHQPTVEALRLSDECSP